MAGVHYDLLNAVRDYRIPDPAARLLNDNLPLVIAAITAGGKTSTVAHIIEKSNYRHVITHTTRPPRPDEQNGVNYWFVDEAEMLRMIKNREFIEVKAIHGDTVYGVSTKSYQSVLSEGHQPLLIIDVQGVKDIVTEVPAIKAFFILPPSYEQWMERLDKRGTMSHVEKSRRLESAKQEILSVLNDPHFVLIVNHDIAATAQEILDGPQMVNQPKNRQIAQHLIDNIKT